MTRLGAFIVLGAAPAAGQVTEPSRPALGKPPAQSVPDESIGQDPTRQYFFVPAELLPRRDEPSRGEPAKVGEGRPEATTALAKQQAARLYEQAGEKVKSGEASIAFRKLHEVLFWDPDHVDARRILGLGRRRSSPVSPAERIGRRAHARFGWPAGTYRRVTTAHYTIWSNASRQDGAQLAYELERLWAVWRQICFPWWAQPQQLQAAWSGRRVLPRSRRRYQVVLFGSQQEYVHWLKQIEPQAERTRGYYHAASRTAYFYTSDPPPRTTWRHEGAHQLFQEQPWTSERPGERLAAWAVEGAAMFFESLQPCGPYVTLGGLETERLQYARYRRLKEDYFVPLDQFESLGRRQLQARSDLAAVYSQAAGIAQMLLADPDPVVRRRMLDYLREVYAPSGHPASLARRLQVSDDTLAAMYVRFLRITDEQLATLDRRIAPRNLVLAGTEVTDRGLEQMADWSELIWLDLAARPVTDRGLDRLVESRLLRRLDLQSTRISDRTVTRLGEARQLQELDLSGTAITDTSMSVLSTLPSLERLWLRSTTVTDAGVRKLLAAPKLRTLDVSQTGISPELQRLIQSRLGGSQP